MKELLFLAICVLVFGTPVSGQNKASEKAVIDAVKSFYAGFSDGKFATAETYTTEDWNHINPFGGRTVGREAVLKEVRAVHSTFLKGVTDTPETFDVSFPSSNVASVVVPSRLSPFTTPDGVKHENDRNIRTFILVKRDGRWLIKHDHNTFIQPQP
jgi:uncharacterized protein (TIGR02246 family)